MTRFLALVRKDLLLALRDWHGLLLLFAMPMVFVVIMSLALRDTLDTDGPRIDALVIDRSGLDQGPELIAALRRTGGFRFITGPEAFLTDPQAAVENDEYAFLLTLTDANDSGNPELGPLDASLLVGPGTSAQIEALMTGTLRQALAMQSAALALQGLRNNGIAGLPDKIGEVPVTVTYGRKADHGAKPTSVQQNVPGWLVFGMFFAVIPLSNALIGERQQGTLRRLRTMAMPSALPMMTKLVPYFLINLIQACLMFAAGVYLVPALGGEALALGNSPAGLLVITTGVSIAALGYGLLIATVAQTTDQAVTMGGAGNIVLGAIGGIMVPRFIMPEAMQNLALLSPMSWGLDGFLDLLLRQGGVLQVLPEFAALALFGLSALGLALFIQSHRPG
jgi:ABC-2 type transport system permease protein